MLTERTASSHRDQVIQFCARRINHNYVIYIDLHEVHNKNTSSKNDVVTIYEAQFYSQGV